MLDSKTNIAPMLAVRSATYAIEFYKKAFDAEELWRIEAGGHVVAGLSIDGANFFLADESPSHDTHSPDSIGTTVRIELFVTDPKAIAARAIAAGATELNPVVEHQYNTIGTRPINKMLQGAIRDPFGHIWLVGRILDQWNSYLEKLRYRFIDPTLTCCGGLGKLSALVEWERISEITLYKICDLMAWW